MPLRLKWQFRKVYCYFGESFFKMKWSGPSNRTRIDVLVTAGERDTSTETGCHPDCSSSLLSGCTSGGDPGNVEKNPTGREGGGRGGRQTPSSLNPAIGAARGFRDAGWLIDLQLGAVRRRGLFRPPRPLIAPLVLIKSSAT